MKGTIAKGSAEAGAQNRPILVLSDSVAVAEAMVGSLPFASLRAQPLDDGRVAISSESEPALAILVAFDPATAATGIRRLRQRWHAVRVLVVGLENDEGSIVRTLALGAAGIVTRHESLDALRVAAEEVMAGHFRAPHHLMRPLFERLIAVRNGARAGKQAPLARLSAREVDVLARLARGESNKDIAVQLHVEVQTVKNHVSHILRKLGVQNRYDAVRVSEPLVRGGGQ